MFLKWMEKYSFRDHISHLGYYSLVKPVKPVSFIQPPTLRESYVILWVMNTFILMQRLTCHIIKECNFFSQRSRCYTKQLHKNCIRKKKNTCNDMWKTLKENAPPFSQGHPLNALLIYRVPEWDSR